MRIGAAAAPRWWDRDSARLPDYLAHLVAIGCTSVELIVHHGSATRDPSTVHLDQAHWPFAIDEASRLGLHVDVHNSLDARFALARWGDDRARFTATLGPILDLLSAIEPRQLQAPTFVVHAADCETLTAEAVTWLSAELDRRGSDAWIAIELRGAADRGDDRFDRGFDTLVDFLTRLANHRIGICWDVANDWLNARRQGVPFELPTSLHPCIRHVHLHDAAMDGSLHAPLGDDGVPWAAAIDLLHTLEWGGSVTLEIRYRSAHDRGDPWTVLAESVRRAMSVR